MFEHIRHGVVAAIVSWLVHIHMFLLINPEVTDKCISALISVIAGVLSGLLSKLVSVWLKRLEQSEKNS